VAVYVLTVKKMQIRFDSKRKCLVCGSLKREVNQSGVDANPVGLLSDFE